MSIQSRPSTPSRPTSLAKFNAVWEKLMAEIHGEKDLDLINYSDFKEQIASIITGNPACPPAPKKERKKKISSDSDDSKKEEKKEKKKPSAYNNFVSEQMGLLKTSRPELSAKERMIESSKLWKMMEGEEKAKFVK